MPLTTPAVREWNEDLAEEPFFLGFGVAVGAISRKVS